MKNEWRINEEWMKNEWRMNEEWKNEWWKNEWMKNEWVKNESTMNEQWMNNEWTMNEEWKMKNEERKIKSQVLLVWFVSEAYLDEDEFEAAVELRIVAVELGDEGVLDPVG